MSINLGTCNDLTVYSYNLILASYSLLATLLASSSLLQWDPSPSPFSVCMKINMVNYFIVCVLLKWSMSNTPYLIHENSIAPHITSTGVHLVMESLHAIFRVQKKLYAQSHNVHTAHIIIILFNYFSPISNSSNSDFM